jgi:hypothetical protein
MRESEPARVVEIAKHVGEFVQQLGEVTLTNLAAISALTAIMLYVTGLLRRVAQLHAEGVATTRGLAFSSLQDYLVEGLAVIVSPKTAVLILFIVCCGLAAFFLPRLAPLVDDVPAYPDADEERAVQPDDELDNELDGASPNRRRQQGVGSKRRVRWFRPLVIGAIFVPCVLCVLFVPLAVWGPLVVAAAPLGALVYINSQYHILNFNSWSEWSMVHARSTVAAVGATFALMAALYSYCDPPPLNRAVIRTARGRQVTGGLLAESSGLVYLVGPRDSDHRAEILALPLADVAVIHIEEGVLRA